MQVCVRQGQIVALIGMIVAVSVPGIAQDRAPSEIELRLDAGLRVSLPHDMKVGITQLVRFDDGVSRCYQVAPELTFAYAPLRWLQLTAGYRYEYERNSTDRFQHRHRIFANAVFPVSLAYVDLIVRAQWQVELRSTTDDAPFEFHLLRLRLMLKFPVVPVVTPYTSVETFQRIDSLDNDADTGAITTLRFLSGLEWPVSGLTMNVGYFVELPTRSSIDPLRHAFILGGRFQLVP